MTISRRSVLQAAIASSVATFTNEGMSMDRAAQPSQILLVSTWKFGKPVNDEALVTWQRTHSLLDAIEHGIWIAEADPENSSVGLGGIPNRAGVVQLDASIMWGPTHAAGCVAALEGFLHPISVARRVMEKTPHVMLVGEGAREFAVQQGFKLTELLTPQRRREWEDWKKQQAAKSDSHDTITLLGLNGAGEIAAGCSTSGWGYKLPGRVGDSPIIGSGLYVDNEVGAAGSTGLGEIMMRYCSAFMIVEEMRRGATPQDACRETVERIVRKEQPLRKNLSVNVVALDRQGRWGAAGTDAEFCAAVTTQTESAIQKAQILTT